MFFITKKAGEGPNCGQVGATVGSEVGRALEHRGCMREFFSMSSSLMSTIGRREDDQKFQRGDALTISDEDGSGHLVTRSQPSRILCTQNFVIINDQDTILQCAITHCCCRCFCCVPNHVPHKHCDVISGLGWTGWKWSGEMERKMPVFNGVLVIATITWARIIFYCLKRITGSFHSLLDRAL